MRILIVDDSKFAQKIIARLFSEAFPNYEIITADNGVAGYDRFKRLKPDIIVTDLLMPNMSGQEFIKKVRETDKNVIIFILTADVQQSIKTELLGLNIAAFINKPLNKNKMVEVQRIVGERIDAK